VSVRVVGPEQGHLLLRTRREGLAASVGHDLTIEATHWSAEVTLPADGVSARVELDSLRVREGTGGALPLTDRDRTEIQANISSILGSGAATFTSTAVTRGDGGGEVEGTLTLRGVSRPLRLRVDEDGAGYRVTATITQSAYGIKPYRAFLGALKLRDDVEVELVLSDPNG
jgi:YceI-like domain